MSTQKYIAPLSRLIDASQIPGDFDSIESLANEGIDFLLQNIFYKDYVADNSSSLDVSYHHLVIITKSLRLPILETGLSLVFFKGSDVTLSEFSITFDVRWPIKKYISAFNIEGFSYTPQALVDIFLELTNTDEQTFYGDIVSVFLNDGNDNYLDFFTSLKSNIEFFLGDSTDADIEIINISNQLDILKDEVEDLLMTTDLYTAIDIFENYEENSVISNAVQSINASLEVLNDNYDVEINIFKEVVVSAISTFSVNEAFDKLVDLFGNWLDDISIQQVKDLLIPQVTFQLNNINMGLEFPRKWLVPVNTGEDPGLNINDPLPEPYKSTLEFIIGNLKYSTLEGFQFENQSDFTFKRSMIGNTGLLVEFYNLKVDMSDSYNIPEAIADGRPDNFQGVYAAEAAITLPSKWFNNVDNTTLRIAGYNMLIGTGGVSGTIALETVGGQPNSGAAYMNLKIGNWEVGFNYFDLTFKQNAIVESNIAGRLKIPKLKDAQNNNAEIYINGHINESGDFNLTASEPEGIPFTLLNFVTFNFLSLELGRENDKFYIGTSCQIWFQNSVMAKLIGDQIIEIPRLRVYDNGTIEIVGGNGFLPLNISLNLGPVEMAVTGVHYGSTQLKYGNDMRKYNYWGFDGAISIDPLGIDVRGDGIKYYYTTDNDEFGGNGDSFIHIKTLAIDLIIPGTASPESAVAIIHGMLSLPDPGESPEYIGEVSLKLPKAKIAGGVSMRLQPRHPAFLIDAFIDLPSPIPIGPVGIYGFRGLLGYRYVATKEAVGLTSDDRWYDYYVYPPRGIHTSKFIGPPRSLDYTTPVALGVGAVLGTSFDSGTVISARIMLVLSLPTLFMIDGRASILSARLGLESTKEPPFFAFVAWGDDSIEMGMGADFKMPTSNGWILKLYAEVQAGFFFNSPSAWYVNLGTKQNPITAKVLTLVTAQSYLMLSAQGIETGARVHFELKKRFGPAKVHLYAYLEIGGYISFERPQIGGYVAAGGGIDVDIWIIGISLSLNAILSAEAAKPFLIYAEVRFRACAKVAFVRVCKSFTVKLKWEKSTAVDRSPVSPLPSSGSVNRANELVKGIHMLTNDTFDLKFFTTPPTVGQIDKVIPLDTYIEIKTEKGLVPGGVSGKIGGYTFAPQNCVDLIPPQKVVRGGHQLRQVKHRYSIENIEIKAWNGNSWQDYHPFEAVVDADNRPNVSGLRVGYWQIKEKQYDTIRLLATTPFTYMEAGEPGWHIPEVYGITPSTLYCQEELRKETCVNVLNKPLGTIYYPPTQYVGEYINGAYFTLLYAPLPEFENGEVTYDMSEYMEVTNAENLHGFAKSLSFNNSNAMVIILPEPSAEVKLKFTTHAQGATISYYRSVIEDSTSIVQYELIHQVYKTAAEINNNVIEYTNENKPIAKVVINPDDANLVAIQQISEQIAELFETTYDNVSGEVSITEPSDVKLYRELVKKLEELKSKGCSGEKDDSDPKLCGLNDHLSGLFNDHFIYPIDRVDDVIREQEYFNQFNSSLLVFDRENPDYRLIDSMGNTYKRFAENLDRLNFLIYVYPKETTDEEVIEGYYEFRKSSADILNYTKETGKCGCQPYNPRICELYERLLLLYNNCFVPIKTSKEVDENIKCFLEFQSVVEIINELVFNEELINVYNNYVKLLEQIQGLIGHHEQILRFYRLKEYAEQILTIVNALGNCNCDDKPDLNCTTSLQQICWLSLEDYQWNLTVPGSEAIEEDFEDMTAAVQKVAQPVWRPNTSYYIRIQLKDEVDDGASQSGIYNYYYGFKTVGPLGHYHKNPASGYLPPGANVDEYTLTSLRSYIDYNRSYPNADGNILKSKPLFYGNQQCKISVFFNKPSTYHMFQTWEGYLNLPELDGQLHIAIKDPVTDVIIPYPLPANYDETVPFPDENGYLWDEDNNPQLPVHIQVINNMIENGQLPCEIDLGDPIVPASSFFNVTLMNLRPQKLYTALLYNAFEVTNNNVVSEPVHEFVFQTSRYENFGEQVNSYLIQDEETETERQAVFTLELSLDNTAITKALDIVSNPNSQINDPLGNSYQHLFDRVIEGVFEIIPSDPPVRTEFHKIVNLLTDDVVAILIKNPEPFNIPKILLEEVGEMIAVVSNGSVNSDYKVLYSKDYSQALIMHTSAKITTGTLDFNFKYYAWNGSQYTVADDVLVENININD